MKLAAWARTVGVHPKTAYRWFHRGALPVPASWRPARSSLRSHRASPQQVLPRYARVSSHDHRADLDRQIARLTVWAGRHGYTVSRTEAEVGSGLHGRRRRLMRLRADPQISTIIVEPRDRRARFGAEYVEAALAASGGAW